MGYIAQKKRIINYLLFRMGSRLNAEGLIEVYATKERIEEGRVAVLGMKKRI
ncbi:hypothetical protein ACFS3C_24970 [Azotobacter vinelandii]